MIAHSGGINWIQYLEYTIVEPEVVKIDREYRLHKYDHTNHPETDVVFRLDREADGFISGVYLNNKYHIAV
jgi:hypothetical protein